MFVHGPPTPLTVAGGHQVNFGAARPVWLANAPCLKRPNTAVFMPAFIVPIAASRRTAGGPVAELRVGNWRTAGIDVLPIALIVVIGAGFLSAMVGSVNWPPTPMPVVAIFLPTPATTPPGACGMHPRSIPPRVLAPI